MKRMRVVFVGVFFLSVLPPVSRAQERPIVAVFEMQDRGSGFDQEALNKLTAFLSARLTEGGFQVIPQDQIRKRLTEQKKDSYKACHDQSCQIELGRELAAQKTLSTQILKIGETCQVTATLYDLKKSTAERAATAGGACKEDLMLKAIVEISAKLCKPLNFKQPAQDASSAPKVKTLPGTLVVNTEPAGATVNVDGEDVGKSPLTVELASGEYPVKVSRPGYEALSMKTTVISGRKIDIQLELDGIYPMHPLDKWGHASFWSGLGLLAFSGVSAIQIAFARDDYQAGDWGAQDKVRTWSGLMFASLGTGAALAVTGVVLWILAPSEAEWVEEWVQSQGVTAGAATDGSGFVFTLGGRW
ncbi:MAG: PEGA domain-containing protein [Deltaproteobacteria bacterium]|nr:PEGA domain-containing protein [Deltaproteobacteria bacterium]